MPNMLKRRRRVILYLAIVVSIPVLSLLSMPGAVACVFIDQSRLVEYTNNRYSQSTDTNIHERYDALLTDARQRVVNTFGSSNSDPLIIFFDSADAFPFFNPNPFGSAQFIGNRACLFIGPEGQNVDVVAHELMHADIFNHIGPFKRWLHLPMWVDEGLAMQVDFRPQYQLNDISDAELIDVETWTTYRKFFDVPDGNLTRRYGIAKHHVAEWVESIGPDAVFDQLDQLPF